MLKSQSGHLKRFQANSNQRRPLAKSLHRAYAVAKATWLLVLTKRAMDWSKKHTTLT